LRHDLHVPENRQTPAHTHTHKEASEAERLMCAALETWSARSREPTDAGTHTHTQRGRWGRDHVRCSWDLVCTFQRNGRRRSRPRCSRLVGTELPFSVSTYIAKQWTATHSWYTRSFAPVHHQMSGHKSKNKHSHTLTHLPLPCYVVSDHVLSAGTLNWLD